MGTNDIYRNAWMRISTKGIWIEVFLALEKKKYIDFLTLHGIEDIVHGCLVDTRYTNDN